MAEMMDFLKSIFEISVTKYGSISSLCQTVSMDIFQSLILMVFGC